MADRIRIEVKAAPIRCSIASRKISITVRAAQGAKGVDGDDGLNGDAGLSAYQIAVNNGYVGSEIDWLDSLQGQDGTNGTNGTDASVTEANIVAALSGVASSNTINDTDVVWVENSTKTVGKWVPWLTGIIQKIKNFPVDFVIAGRLTANGQGEFGSLSLNDVPTKKHVMYNYMYGINSAGSQAATNVGSGSTNVGMYLDSSNVANSSAKLYWFGSSFTQWFTPQGPSMDQGLNFTRRFRIAFTLGIRSITNNGRYLMLIGSDSSVAATAQSYVPVVKCFGLEIVGTALKAYGYNTSIITGSSYTVVSGTSYEILLDVYNGTINVYVNGVLASTVSGAPTSPSVVNNYSLFIEASCTATNNRFVCSHGSLRYLITDN